MTDEQLAALERQADALEAVATELRYQNAALVELISSMDDLAARVDEHHHSEGEPRDRSGAALQTAVADRLFERDDRENRPMSSRGLGRAENWKSGSK